MSWQNSGIEAPSVNNNIMDPTEHQWCPEIVDIMAKYGQKPEDFIVSDDDDETDIQGSDGEQFPTNDLENTHYYATKTEKEQLPMLKIKIRGFQAGANRKRSSSELSSPSSGARPISAIHNTKGDSDDTEFENIQVDSERYDTPDERHDSEPDDTQDNQPKLKASSRLCQ